MSLILAAAIAGALLLLRRRGTSGADAADAASAPDAPTQHGFTERPTDAGYTEYGPEVGGLDSPVTVAETDGVSLTADGWLVVQSAGADSPAIAVGGSEAHQIAYAQAYGAARAAGATDAEARAAGQAAADAAQELQGRLYAAQADAEFAIASGEAGEAARQQQIAADAALAQRGADWNRLVRDGMRRIKASAQWRQLPAAERAALEPRIRSLAGIWQEQSVPWQPYGGWQGIAMNPAYYGRER